MLPFLKPKKLSAIIIAKTKPEGGVEPIAEEGEQTPEMVGIAEQLISAINSKDANAVAEALQAAHECAMYAHEETEEEY
jgi:hypothetical protein